VRFSETLKRDLEKIEETLFGKGVIFILRFLAAYNLGLFHPINIFLSF